MNNYKDEVRELQGQDIDTMKQYYALHRKLELRKNPIRTHETIELSGDKISIDAYYTGWEKPPKSWGDQEGKLRVKYIVKFTVKDESESIDFYTSLLNPLMQRNTLIYTFYCGLSDASYGYMSFDDFCDELGYEKPSQAYNAWQGCKKTLRKFKNLFPGKDLYDLMNEYQEKYEEYL